MLRSADEAKEIANLVDPLDFFDHDDRQLFLFLANMAENGATVTPQSAYRAIRVDAPRLLTLTESYCRLAVSDAIATEVRIEPITDTIATFKRYSYTVRLTRIIDNALTELEDRTAVDLVEANLEARMTRLRSNVISEIAKDDTKAQMQEVAEHILSELPTGLKYGFDNLDRNTVPMMYGNLILVAGTTGSGKSMVARNILRKIVLDNPDVKAALHSIEMTSLEQWVNIAAMDANIDTERAFQPTLLTKDEQDRLGNAAAWWKQDNRLRINDRGDVTPRQLLQTMQRYRHEGVTVQVIDHLHEVDYTGEEDLRIAIGQMAKSLKGFAKGTRSIVIALVQLVKMDKSIEPNDGHIREAAKIGESADRILFVYRPLIACEPGHNGQLIAHTKGTFGDARYMAHEVTKKMQNEGIVLSHDDERVYIKLGKARLRPRQGLVSIRFDAPSGLMYDLTKKE